ncbi:MAG TPA: nickel-binding protein [Cyclobacteriaceae bacterium]
MPLYMDYHKFSTVTIEDVKNAHLADEKVQDRYGVTYRQFWVNERDGTVFCLMEGPDRESCEAVHREAHGMMACAIVEVDPQYYSQLMGTDLKLDKGHVLRPDGSEDLGYRNILVANVQGNTEIKTPDEYKSLRAPGEARHLIVRTVLKYRGRFAAPMRDDNIVAVFDASIDAVRCAMEIQRELLDRINADDDTWNIIFHIGLSAGQPLTETTDFFEEAVRLAHRICNIASENQVLLSSLIHELCQNEGGAEPKEKFLLRILRPDEEGAIAKLYDAIEARLQEEGLSPTVLANDLNIAVDDLENMVSSLTGRSAEDFLKTVKKEKRLPA